MYRDENRRPGPINQMLTFKGLEPQPAEGRSRRHRAVSGIDQVNIGVTMRPDNPGRAAADPDRGRRADPDHELHGQLLAAGRP